MTKNLQVSILPVWTRWIAVVCFSVLSLASSVAQNYLRNFQVEEGLSNNTVFCSAQDQQGFLWLGTTDGLNRFDGYSFKVFRHDPNDTLSLGDNFIRSLYIDNNNILYVGTRIGVYQYDAWRETFKLLLSCDEVHDIKKDNEGNLWIIAGQTLIKFPKLSKQYRTYPPEDFFAATSICIDTRENLWISTSTGLLQQYHPNTDKFTAHDVFSDKPNATIKWIEKIYATPHHTILVGTSTHGVKEFNVTDFSSRDLLVNNAEGTAIFARNFVQRSDNEIWMATETGIFIYDKLTKAFSNYRKQYNNPYSISDNAVYTLCQDKEGGVWAGTYFGGVNYFPKQGVTFDRFFSDNTAASLSGNVVREICEDKFGNLWIGTEDAGLTKFNRQTNQFTHYKPSGASTDISYHNIHGLLAKDNTLWIGTFEHGLHIMDIATGRVIKHFPDEQNSATLRSNFIVTILGTKRGETYIGTRRGVYRHNPANNSFDLIHGIPTTHLIHALLEDSNGVVWIGTLGNGLFSYEPTRKKVGHFVKQSNNNSICHNSITTLFEDSNRRLWIGSEGGGLCMLNPANNSFENYPAIEELPGKTVYKILEDDKKNLWITTSKGLVRFSMDTHKQIVYTTANGLLSDQFNYNSGYKDASGKMYFGSAKGLISFNPNDFIPDTFSPPLFITSFQVNTEELKVNTEDSPLHQSILFTKQISLAHNQASFSIDFAALNFSAPRMVKYKYKMEGVDADWTSLKENRKVYFTNLSAGHYTFKVKASNSSGVWSNQETQLGITILPPFWLSTTAYIIYFFLAVLVTYLIFQSYHALMTERNKRKIELIEHEKEKEIYQSKFDFFVNVAHEIRTPLTLIKAPLEKIVEKAGDSHVFGNNLKIMESNTDRLIELTEQLLDFKRIENYSIRLTCVTTDINKLLSERHLSFKTLAEQKKIDLSLLLPDATVHADVDIDSMHKILNNLYYNALVYGKRQAIVELQVDKTHFMIIFRNDGHVIPTAMREKIFEPFVRLKETQANPGNGIGLALSKALVLLHQGKLYLDKEHDNFNTFVVQLPFTQAADTVSESAYSTNNNNPA
ncbi:ligand-binding sensor domain-containing protein [Pseudochryseolinea flava]|nr:two-component regulator propeller domain-containing protein [Pseudochryseolinea flava]